MAKRSAVTKLPTQVKAWLDRALVESGFADYKLLEEELKSRGFCISKSSLHRYGQEFEERLALLRTASEQARAVVEAAPDTDGSVNEALIRLVQEKLLGVLVKVEGEAEKTLNMPSVARAIADLCRASVTNKRFQEEVRAQERARARKEMEEELQRRVQALGNAADLKSLSDEELDQRIAALAGGS